MKSIENNVIEGIKKYFWVILLGLIAVASVYIRKQGLPFVSDDYLDFLYPWYVTLKENTGFKGLALDDYTYYIPYLCILAIATYIEGIDLLLYIKIISICFEYLAAVAAALIGYKLLSRANKKWAVIILGVMLFSPMILLNGAYWGQCDLIYIAFIVWSLLMLFDERFTLSFLFLGIGFAFKLQTVFVVPAYLLYYLCNKKFSFVKFLWLPVMYLLGGLPAVIAGRPAKSVYGIYFMQSGYFGQLSMNTPNIWRYFPNLEYDYFKGYGMVLAMAVFCLFAFWAFKNEVVLSKRTLLLMMACSAGISVMFLPGMHERYPILFCMLAYLYFLIYERKKILLPIGLDLIITMSCCGYLFGLKVVPIYQILALINLCILFYMIYHLMELLRYEKANGIEE